jgi:hypothetical protein
MVFAGRSEAISCSEGDCFVASFDFARQTTASFAQDAPRNDDWKLPSTYKRQLLPSERVRDALAMMLQ